MKPQNRLTHKVADEARPLENQSVGYKYRFDIPDFIFHRIATHPSEFISSLALLETGGALEALLACEASLLASQETLSTAL